LAAIVRIICSSYLLAICFIKAVEMMNETLAGKDEPITKIFVKNEQDLSMDKPLMKNVY
jgi:biotin carboxyl carrier protein